MTPLVGLITWARYGAWLGLAAGALGLITLAALPGALFALGGVLVQYRPEGDLRAIAFVCIVSLMIHPSLVWIFGNTLSLQQDLFVRHHQVQQARGRGYDQQNNKQQSQQPRPGQPGLLHLTLPARPAPWR